MELVEIGHSATTSICIAAFFLPALMGVIASSIPIHDRIGLSQHEAKKNSSFLLLSLWHLLLLGEERDTILVKAEESLALSSVVDLAGLGRVAMKRGLARCSQSFLVAQSPLEKMQRRLYVRQLDNGVLFTKAPLALARWRLGSRKLAW